MRGRPLGQVPAELADDPLGHRWGQQGLPGGDHADGAQQFSRLGVLEDEATGANLQVALAG
jgi:hypothetical protein